MSAVRAVEPDPALAEILPGAHFIDAYRVAVAEPGLDAETAARRMFESAPGWVDGLMRLRDAIVAPFGVKTSKEAASSNHRTIGFFPIQSDTPSRIVLGFEDSHLDFRVVVDVVAAADGAAITAATLVRLNNLFGRAYLTAIMPFHRLIVRSMLKQLAARSAHP